MGKLADIREALAGALADINGAEKKAYINKKVATTTLSVVPHPDTPITYHTSFGSGEFQFQIEVITPLNDYVSSQKTVDDFLEPYGDRSVKQAVETSDDPLLAKKTVVTGVDGYRAIQLPEGGGLVLRAVINVTVNASTRAPA